MNWNSVFLVITIASIAVAIYFGVKSIRRKQPVVAWFRHKLIGIGADAPAELRLLFNNVAVPEVYRTTFVVFNRGKLAIRKEDLVSNFRIVFEDGEILRQPIVYEKSSESIGLRASAVQEGGKHQIDLSFDYLNEKDGAVFEVLHTKGADIHTETKLIDVNEIIEMRNLEPMRIGRIRYYFISFLAFCGLFAWGLYETFAHPEETTIEIVERSVNYAPFFLGIAVLWLLTFIPDIRRFFRYHRFPSWSRRWLTEK